MRIETERPAGLTPQTTKRPSAVERLYPYRYWIAAALGLAAFLVWRHVAGAPKKAKGGPPPVPVGTATAVSGDMPVYYDGLGTVTAFYTVNVQSRVSGQLMSVPVKEGQDVKVGDVLCDIDPRPYQAALDQAKGQLARDQALLADANLDLERYKTLVAQNAIPKQQYDTQTYLVSQDSANVMADQASVEAAQVNLIYAHITSPINGRVGLRLVDPGNIINVPNTNPMFVITQLKPIAIVFVLPEDDLPAIMKKVNAGVTLRAEAYNRDMTQHLASGALETVDNQIDPNSGTVKLKAIFPNKENTLFPNQFVNVRLLLDTLHGQVIVPSAAVQTGAQGDYVYVVQPDSTVALKTVKVGIVESNQTSIISGLEPGDSVVVDGADKLQPGSPVTPTASNATAAPDGAAIPAAQPAQAGAAVPGGKPARRKSRTPRPEAQGTAP